jgi:glycine/D-amino acid oxidase-like deaminating enzyme
MSRPAELADVEERSFWQAPMPALPDRRGGDLPDTADVVVIGGGYTGLSAARRAAELGASVVLLEAETLGWGASTRNGGMCHPGFKWGISSLRKRHGAALGEQLYRDSINAFEQVASLCGPDGPIDADFVRSGHLELAFTPAHAAHQQATADALAHADMPAHVVAREDLREEIGSDAYHGGLVVERSGGLHPGKFLAGLVSLAADAGAGLHEGIRARSIRRQADGRLVVETSRQALIARDVIVATNGYTDGVAPALRRRIMSIGSYIIATDPLPADLAAEISPRGRMFFDTKNFLYYWRLTPDRRMLFGGRASMWPTTIAHTAAILQRGMVEVHPQLAGTRVAYAWGGRVGFTFDRMPHVGRSKGVTYAVGCCGSGVAILPWLGTRVAEWVGGGQAPALAKLRFPLVPAPYEGRAWFLPFAGEWWRMRDRVAARAARDASATSDPEPVAGG